MNEEQLKINEVEISKMELTENSVIVCKLPIPFCEPQRMGELRGVLDLMFPDTKILIISKEIDLSIIECVCKGEEK